MIKAVAYQLQAEAVSSQAYDWSEQAVGGSLL